MVCPKCKSDQAHRSHHRGVWEYIVGVLAVFPCRCHGCEHRFLRFRFESPLPAAASGVEREVRSTRRSIKWRSRRRELLLYGTGFLVFMAFLYYLTRPRDGGGESPEP